MAENDRFTAGETPPLKSNKMKYVSSKQVFRGGKNPIMARLGNEIEKKIKRFRSFSTPIIGDPLAADNWRVCTGNVQFYALISRRLNLRWRLGLRPSDHPILNFEFFGFPVFFWIVCPSQFLVRCCCGDNSISERPFFDGNRQRGKTKFEPDSSKNHINKNKKHVQTRKVRLIRYSTNTTYTIYKNTEYYIVSCTISTRI